jgi:hypothetical protein
MCIAVRLIFRKTLGLSTYPLGQPSRHPAQWSKVMPERYVRSRSTVVFNAAETPSGRSVLPGQPGPDSDALVSARNSTGNDAIHHLVLTRTISPSIPPSGTIHKPSNHFRLVVGPKCTFAGRYGTCRSRRSSSQNNCIRQESSTDRAPRISKMLIAKKGERAETVHTAFQDFKGREFRQHPEQPMTRARGRDWAAIGGPAKTGNAQGSSSICQEYQKTQKRCGEVHKRHVISMGWDRKPPISCSTPREDTAFCPHTWSAPSCPRITCDDGDGDVKPAHPSGPGTYGHVM